MTVQREMQMTDDLYRILHVVCDLKAVDRDEVYYWYERVNYVRLLESLNKP